MGNAVRVVHIGAFDVNISIPSAAVAGATVRDWHRISVIWGDYERQIVTKVLRNASCGGGGDERACSRLRRRRNRIHFNTKKMGGMQRPNQRYGGGLLKCVIGSDQRGIMCKNEAESMQSKSTKKTQIKTNLRNRSKIIAHFTLIRANVGKHEIRAGKKGGTSGETGTKVHCTFRAKKKKKKCLQLRWVAPHWRIHTLWKEKHHVTSACACFCNAEYQKHSAR